MPYIVVKTSPYPSNPDEFFCGFSDCGESQWAENDYESEVPENIPGIMIFSDFDAAKITMDSMTQFTGQYMGIQEVFP